MVNLADILDTRELDKLIDLGYIKVQTHPRGKLDIYNYTNKAQFDRVWTPETRACRGLIADEDGTVFARPFPKFFNMEEHGEDEPIWGAPFVVTEKMDGSLGILYQHPDEELPAIATRGSFTSDQAKWATELLRTKYKDFCSWYTHERLLDWSFLFEIIYNTNRIVVNYEHEDLVLLAASDTRTGIDDDDVFGVWTGPLVRRFDSSCPPRDVLTALDIPQDGSCEGLVLRFDYPRGSHTRVKVKTDEYKRLHRIVTGVSNKTVWEHMRAGRPLDELLDRVPDEFNAWVKKTRYALNCEYSAIDLEARMQYMVLENTAGPRAEFAARAKETRYPGLMFMLLDGREDKYRDAVWKMVRPEWESPFARGEEDG